MSSHQSSHFLSSTPDYSLNWKQLQEQAVEVRISHKSWGETRVLNVIYDKANTAHFEGRICVTCGAMSDYLDAKKSLSHMGCRIVEIVCIIGDNISTKIPSCFEGLKEKDLKRICTAVKIEHCRNQWLDQNKDPQEIAAILTLQGHKDLDSKPLHIVADY